MKRNLVAFKNMFTMPGIKHIPDNANDVKPTAFVCVYTCVHTQTVCNYTC
jgi:hypothetical protein